MFISKESTSNNGGVPFLLKVKLTDSDDCIHKYNYIYNNSVM